MEPRGISSTTSTISRSGGAEIGHPAASLTITIVRANPWSTAHGQAGEHIEAWERTKNTYRSSSKPVGGAIQACATSSKSHQPTGHPRLREGRPRNRHCVEPRGRCRPGRVCSADGAVSAGWCAGHRVTGIDPILGHSVLQQAFPKADATKKAGCGRCAAHRQVDSVLPIDISSLQKPVEMCSTYSKQISCAALVPLCLLQCVADLQIRLRLKVTLQRGTCLLASSW